MGISVDITPEERAKLTAESDSVLALETLFEEAIETALANSPTQGTGQACVHYRNLKPGEGHSQGDQYIQYLGDYKLNTALTRLLECKGEIRRLEVDGSHVLSGDLIQYEFRRPNSLISHVVFNRGTMVNEHPEHAWEYFEQPGWYVVRWQRSGVLTDAEAEAEVKRAID